MKTFYVTKYALTSGIMEFEEKDPAETQWPNMLVIGREKNFFHGEGKDWHRTKEAASCRAEQMRLKKINALKAKIKKLEALKF